METKDSLQAKLGGLLIHTIVRNWMSTLDCQIVYAEPSVDPAAPEFHGPVVFIFWHEYIPCPFYARPHCNIAMLISRHSDAEWLSQAARHTGFQTVRGSTSRGGGAALRALFRKSRTMNLAITPDGPRGPRRELASGCIYAASKLGAPLVPFGIGYDRPWRLSTWDRFAVPRPYSRARIVVGPRTWIPGNLDRDGIETHRQAVERLLCDLTDEAEHWAARGHRRDGQMVLRPLCAALRSASRTPPDLAALPLPQTRRRSA